MQFIFVSFANITMSNVWLSKGYSDLTMMVELCSDFAVNSFVSVITAF